MFLTINPYPHSNMSLNNNESAKRSALQCLNCPSALVPHVTKCSNILQLSKCPSRFQAPKCPKCLIAQVLKRFKYPNTSVAQVLKRFKCQTASVVFNTTQKGKLSIKDFFCKYDLIRSFLQICLHLLKKSLMGNFIFLQ